MSIDAAVARPGTGRAEEEARAWLEEHVARVVPVGREAHAAVWDAATGGADDAMERCARARTEYKRLHSDPAAARRVREWLARRELRDPALRRQLVLVELEMTGSLLPEQTLEDLVRRGAELEHVFHTFRAELGGERVSNNVLLETLATERDEARRREAWEAGKAVGREVAEGLRELVRRRNAAARSLSFDHFYAMELHQQELGEERLFAIMDEFARRSDEPFRAFRERQDAEMAARFGIRPEALRPWHWEDLFGQEAPSTGAVDLDAFFRGRDVVPTVAEFFRGIGLSVDDVLARSDLYEREGKDQHAFCLNVDREGEVRVLCNMRDNEKWATTLLHELGHAAYDVFLPPELPYLLRINAHTLSTEAVAMYFGRLARDPLWLREVMGAELSESEAEDVRAQLRSSMLVSTRWMLVMVHFERELYRDPDRPDLNRLWWDLVERFQMIRRPEGRDEPDWAAKPHLSMSPVYYHNYLLGELMASQISATARREVPTGRSIAGQPSVGRFLRERIFAPGASLDWNELLVHATGEGLSSRSFVEEFVGTA